MKTLPLTKGKVVIVDDEDYEWLNNWKWTLKDCSGPNLYAVRKKRYGPGGKRQVLLRMHREILKAPKGTTVDHINGNGLDNRRCNLRICTTQENLRNRRRKVANCTSRYKGVHKTGKVWTSQITVDCKAFHVASCRTEEEAALAYNEAAEIFFGEFAALNDVPS